MVFNLIQTDPYPRKYLDLSTFPQPHVNRVRAGPIVHLCKGFVQKCKVCRSAKCTKYVCICTKRAEVQSAEVQSRFVLGFVQVCASVQKCKACLC